ncbi:MAG: hypothetical protein WBP81_35655 [Solirubrobacteraceae bacterium]
MPGIRGEKIVALAITEPDTGSDVASIRTRAQDPGWLSRQRRKDVHHHGVRADTIVTAVRTTEQGGHRGLPS